MATFHSRKHPSLVVKFSDRTSVRFDRGSVEVEGKAVEKLASFAERHPEYEIERVDDGSDDRPLTPKQKAVARAEELGLDTSGKLADIEARIAAFEAEEGSDESSDADDDGEQDGEDDSDADGSDDA